jgi:hypothetical protein
VQGSSRGLECEGHLGGKYIPEPTPEQVAWALEDAKRLVAEQKASKEKFDRQQEEKYQRNRWFRPLEKLIKLRAIIPDPWIQEMSDPVLLCVFSMIGDGVFAVNEQWREFELRDLGLPIVAEVIRRGLEFPEGGYELKLAPWFDDRWVPNREDPFKPEQLKVDLTYLSNRELQLWEACCAWVVDYSTLEAGTRQVIMSLCDSLQKELERRKVPSEFLLDFEPAP